jgi:peptidoglycan/LPS O-acetylase OafA/YrhL
VDPRLRAVRLAALAGGAAALLAAMLFLPEPSRWRDLVWSVGVALLVLAIVVNRLIVRQERARVREVGTSDRAPGA